MFVCVCQHKVHSEESGKTRSREQVHGRTITHTLERVQPAHRQASVQNISSFVSVLCVSGQK